MDAAIALTITRPTVCIEHERCSVFLFKSPINANNRFVFGSTSADPSCGDFGGNANASVIVDFPSSGTLTPGFTDAVSFPVINDDAPTAFFSVSIFGAGNTLLATIQGWCY